jgi:hypothetical protein
MQIAKCNVWRKFQPPPQEGTEKIPSEIKKKNSNKFRINALRIAYLQQRVNCFSNIARKRAYTNTIVQALNLTVVFQCPPSLAPGISAFNFMNLIT